MRLDQALDSWTIDLRASAKRPRTIEVYHLAVLQLSDYLKNRGHSLDVEEITRGDIRSFIGHVLDTRSAATAKQRHGSLSVFFGWLLGEAEIESNPMLGLSPPRVVEKPIPVLSQRHFDLLVGDCDTSFVGKRDEAIIRGLWDSGMRVSELIGLGEVDVNLGEQFVWVQGKGGKLRRSPFTIATAYSLDRYLRSRQKHRLAHLPELFIGERGALTRNGIAQMLYRRSDRIGLGRVGPHMFRHSLADRWLSAGGDEGGLMSVMGWSKGSRAMLDRYGSSVAAERAIGTYRRLFD